ncbi:MAG TPA: hypothetical protein P5550_11640, partial [Bacteroidales bacterium]|nr:hypothetical protein [Bacteroidales bacterium]
LAGLLKISALLSFAAILGLLILEMSGLKLDQQRRIFVHPLRYGLILIGVAGIQLLWYSYAQHYNNQHNAGIFLLGILPVWDMDAAAIQATMDGVRHHLRWDYFRQETQLLLVGMFLTVLIFFRHLPRILLGLMLMVSTGFIVYIILFFNALKDHDYYTINLFILVPITLLAFLTLMKTRFPGVFASATLKVLLLALLIHNADFARRRMEGRYHPQGWENSYFVNNTSAYRDAGPYLDSLGIGRDARVISLSDPSINITLYLMDRKGWTDFNIGGDSLRLQEVVARGADYLFISDTGTYRQAGVKALLQYKVGQYRHIAIYRLRGG